MATRKSHYTYLPKGATKKLKAAGINPWTVVYRMKYKGDSFDEAVDYVAKMKKRITRGTRLPKGSFKKLRAIGFDPGTIGRRMREKGMTFEEATAYPVQNKNYETKTQ